MCQFPTLFNASLGRARFIGGSEIIDIKGPSMEIYYRKLVAIARGHWWIFAYSDDEKGNAEKWNAKNRMCVRRCCQAQTNQLLSIDIPEYLRRSLLVEMRVLALQMSKLHCSRVWTRP